MYQSFKTSASKEAGPARLKALQKEMRSQGVSHYLIPHADEYQNEYPPEQAERLAWLTGFTGSAGFAIATLENCVVFVDGRYTLQVRDQIDADHFTPENLISKPPSKWLKANTGKGHCIAYDPWLITTSQLETFEKSVAASGAELKPMDNLIDRVWENQPAPPLGQVRLHPLEYAGKLAEDKIPEIQATIVEAGADFALLTDPASLAWLFNIRGTDTTHNPLALGFALVPAKDQPLLFLDGRKLSSETRNHLEAIASIQDPGSLLTRLSEITSGTSVMCDANGVSVALTSCIKEAGGTILKKRDPVALPRALKNETELNGARAAHVRDGVAMCLFLHWLDTQSPDSLHEIGVAKKLEEFRISNAKAMGSELQEISFDTISGHGPNGAIVHYRVTEKTNRPFTNHALYLVDSGGQYLDGTTDITRTIAIGKPPENAVTDFTLVLKGHIALATARFPEGTRGVDLDGLARGALWKHGKDYAHGTGHGIGSYLNVHEGPQSISMRGMEPLQPGMIISNEPGYYLEGEYGIRIENLVIVEEAKEISGGTIKTQGFETITLAPIDLRLIDKALLTDDERDWLNAYHARVFDTLSEHLEEAAKDWLKQATRQI